MLDPHSRSNRSPTHHSFTFPSPTHQSFDFGPPDTARFIFTPSRPADSVPSTMELIYQLLFPRAARRELENESDLTDDSETMSYSSTPSHNNTSPTNMPYPGTCGAPKTFNGDVDDIVEFLEHFENCAKNARLPDEEKVDHFMRYLSKKQKAVFRIFDGYSNRNWPLFRTTIEAVFAAAFDGVDDEIYYTRQSLINFATEAATKQITTVNAMEAYYREFRAIGQSLVAQNRITQEECNNYFWFGLHEMTRLRLEGDLSTKHPDHPMETPYSTGQVRAAGRRVFNAKSFKNNPPEGMLMT